MCRQACGFEGEADFDEDFAGGGGNGKGANAVGLEFYGDGGGVVGEGE